MKTNVRMLALLAAASMSVVPAVADPDDAVSQLSFSADSRMFAGIYVEPHYGIQFNLGGPNAKSHTTWVLYKDGAKGRPRRVRIATTEKRPPVASVQLRVSPSGEWILLSWDGALLMIEARTANRRLLRPADTWINSFAWRGPAEVIYSAPIKGDTRCGIYVVDVGAAQPHRLVSEIQPARGDHDRRVTWEQDGTECGRHEVWSPTGRFLIYTDAVLKKLRLLDTKAGANTIITPNEVSVTGELVRQMSWKRDETEVVIGLQNDRRPLMFHHNVATGVTTDLSRDFGAVAKKYRKMQPLWTAEGYVLFSAPDVTLVRPVPWEARVVPVAYDFNDPQSIKREALRVLPFPGKLVIASEICRYDGSAVAHLDSTDCWPLISPDGKWVGRITWSDGKISVTPFPAELLKR